MNRIDRISAILIQLQSRRVVKAQDIAERFGISLRTVYRDIRTLGEAGVPLIGEAGLGYSLVEGYRLPPVLFTREEAAAFLTAEKLVEKLTDVSTNADHRSAMFKVRAVLKAADKDYLESIESNIEVLKNHNNFESRHDIGPLQAILNAVSEKKAVSICYFSHYRQENTERCIEPLGMFYQGGYWYIIAFCRMRNSYRNFRTDRISSLNKTESGFAGRHPSLKDYLQQNAVEKDLHEIVIEVTKKAYLHLGAQKYYNGFVSETDKGAVMEMTFFTASPEWFARWFMMFSDQATIIKPFTLRERVDEILSASILNLRGTGAELQNSDT